MKSRIFILLLFPLLLISACSKDDNNDETATRTVLVYIMADNSLSDFSSSDISEMEAGMSNVDATKYNLLIYVDTYDSTPKLIKLDKNSSGKVIETVVKTYDEQTSTDETVMKSVFSSVFSAYPAESYGLVLWSHGDGWIPFQNKISKAITSRWIGQDTNGGTTDNRLNISILASVLSTAPHFDFVLFDACFMSSVEALYDLRSYADYFIGSATEIPGPGAYYTDAVPAMFATSNDAEKVADSYYTYYVVGNFASKDKYLAGDNLSNDNWTAGVSITLVKANELENLAAATKSILPKYVSNKAAIGTSGLFCYDPYRHTYYYDLNALIKQVSGGGSDYTTWKAAFDRCVVKYETTPTNYMSSDDGYDEDVAHSMTGSSGLSAYIPRSSMSTENTEFKQTGWYSAAGWSNTGW